MEKSLRTYVLIENEKGELLVLKELIQGELYFKFPGGGLELGEGWEEAAKRELVEELHLEIELTQLGFFPEVIYSKFHNNVNVYVCYWAGNYHGSIPLDIQEDSVLKEVLWLPPEKAKDYLSFPSDLWALDRYLESKRVQKTGSGV